MNPIEPALLPIPLTTPGLYASSPSTRPLDVIRRDSNYKRARRMISLTLVLELLAGIGVLTIALVTKRFSAPFLTTASAAVVMLVSVIGAEVAVAILDMADLAIHDRLKHLGARQDST